MKILLLILAIVALVFLISKQSEAANTPKSGDTAPDFRLVDQNGTIRSLSDFSGQWVVLYFYPKDDTPGCTKEACSFRDDLTTLEKLGAKVVGVSVDDSDSHSKMRTVRLLSHMVLSRICCCLKLLNVTPSSLIRKAK